MSEQAYKLIGGIYRIVVRTVGTYYGESDNIARRWGRHRKQLANGKHHNMKLRRAWKYLGPSYFSFEIVEQSYELDHSKQLRLLRESALILADPLNLNTAGSEATALRAEALPDKEIYRSRTLYLERIPNGGYAKIRLDSKTGPLLGVESVDGKFRMGLFTTDGECKLTRMR